MDGFYTYFASNGFTYGSTWKNWESLSRWIHMMWYATCGGNLSRGKIRNTDLSGLMWKIHQSMQLSNIKSSCMASMRVNPFDLALEALHQSRLNLQFVAQTKTSIITPDPPLHSPQKNYVKLEVFLPEAKKIMLSLWQVQQEEWPAVYPQRWPWLRRH